MIIDRTKADWGIEDRPLEKNLRGVLTSLMERAVRTLQGFVKTGQFNFLTMPKLEDALKNPNYYNVYGESLTRSIIENNFSSDDNP